MTKVTAPVHDPLIATAATLSERAASEYAQYVARLTPAAKPPKNPAAVRTDALAAAAEARRVIDIAHTGASHLLRARESIGQITPPVLSHAIRELTAARRRAEKAIDETTRDLLERVSS